MNNHITFQLFLLFITLTISSCHQMSSDSSDTDSYFLVEAMDGDSFLAANFEDTIEIRLEGIDAPEHDMAFAKNSRKYLISLIRGKPIEVDKITLDRYNRWVSRCYVSDTIDVSKAMVAAGMAWHFDRFSDDEDLRALEEEAYQNRRGLWADPNAIPPWKYRKIHEHADQ